MSPFDSSKMSLAWRLTLLDIFGGLSGPKIGIISVEILSSFDSIEKKHDNKLFIIKSISSTIIVWSDVPKL